MQLFLSCILALIALAQFESASAFETKATVSPARQPAIMQVYGPASPPFGFVQFCERAPSECAPGYGTSHRVEATPARLAELDRVNRYANFRIKPVTDQEYYGVSEYWTMPQTHGDCEDYGLLKRRILIDLGWPESTLLMTVVIDEAGEGHAVLTVRTTQGDYVLDNKVPDIKIWHQTGYQFVMRQSFVNPRAWVSLDRSVRNSSARMTSQPQR